MPEVYVLLQCYAAYKGNALPTFRENIPVPHSSVNKSKNFGISWPFKMGQRGCPERSVGYYHYTPRNIPGERRYHVRHGVSLISRRDIACWRPPLVAETRSCLLTIKNIEYVYVVFKDCLLVLLWQQSTTGMNRLKINNIYVPLVTAITYWIPKMD